MTEDSIRLAIADRGRSNGAHSTCKLIKTLLDVHEQRPRQPPKTRFSEEITTKEKLGSEQELIGDVSEVIITAT